MSQSPLTPSQTAASPHLSSPYYDGPQYGPGTPNGAVRCASRASNHDSPYVGYSSPGPLPTAANCSAPLFAMEMKQRALLNSCLKTSMAEVNAWNEVASYESGGGAISHYNGGSTPGHATPGHSTPGHATPGHITPGHAMSLDAYGNAEVEELMDQQARAGVIQTFGNGALGEMPPRSHSSAGFYYGGGGAGGSTPLGPNGEVMSAPNSVISAHYSAASSPYGQPHSIHSSTSSSSSSMTPPSVKNGSSGGVLQRPNQTSPSLPFASSSKYCSDSVASSPVTSPLSAGSTLPQVRCHSNSSAAAAPLGTNNSNPNTPYTMNGPMTPGGGPMTPGPMTPGSGQQQQIGNPRTPGALKRDESTSSCGSPFPSNSSDYNNLFASGAKRFAPQGSPASSVSTLKRSPSVEPMSPYSSRLAMQVAPSPASLVNRNSASSPAAATPGTPYGAGQLVSSGLPIGYPNSNASAVTNPYMTPYHQPQYPPSYGMDSSAYGSEPDMEEENIFDDADEDEATFLSKRMAAGMYELNPVALLQNHLRIFEKNMVGQANAERDARQAKMVEAKRAMLAIQNSTNNSVNCHFGPNSSSSSYSGSSGYEPNFADDQKSMVSPSHPQTPFSPMSPAECVKYGQPPNGSRHSMIAPYSTPTSFGSYDLYSSHQQSFSSSASNSPSVASSAGGANGSTPSHQFSRQSSLTHPSSTPNSYGSMPSPSSLPTFHNSFKAMANSSTNSQLRSALRADFNDLLSKQQQQQQQQAQSMGPYNGSLEHAAAAHGHPPGGLTLPASFTKSVNPIESISFDPKTGMMKVRKKRGRPRKNPLPPSAMPVTAFGGHLTGAGGHKSPGAFSSSGSSSLLSSSSSFGYGATSAVPKLDEFEDQYKPMSQDTDPYAFPSFMDPPASMPRSHSTATSQPSSSASQSYSQPHSHAHTSHSHTSSSSSPSVTVSISSSLPPPSSQHSTAAASLHHILHSTNSSQSSAGDTPAKRPRGRPRANDPNRPPPKSKPAPSLASIIPIPGLPGQPAMKRGRGRPKSLKTLVKEAEAAVSQASANGGKVPEELLAYLEQQRAALAAQTAQSQTHQKLAERHQMMNMNRGAFASMMMTAPPTSIPPRFSLQHAINAASSAASRLSTAMSSTSSPRLTTSAGASNCVSTIQSTEQFKSAMSNYVSMATSHQSLSSSVSGTKLSLTTTNTTASSGGGSNKIRHLSDSSSDSSSDFSSDDSSDSSTDTDEIERTLAPSQREREKTTHETAAKDAVGQAELAKREPEPVQPNKDAQQGANEVAASEMSATEEPSANGVDKAVKDVVGYLCDLAAIEVLQEQDPLGEELQQLLERKTLQELLFKMENAPISEDDSAVRNLQLVEFGDPHSNPFRIPATPPVTISRAAPVNALAGQHTDYFLGHPQMGPSFEVSSDEQSSAINSIINCGLEAPPEEEVIAAPVVVDLLIDNDAHQRFLAESGHSFDVESAVENEEEEADTAADHLMQLESTDAVAPEDASTMHNEPHQSPLTTLIEPANQHDTDAAGQTEAVNAAPAPPTQETQPETIESSLEVMPPVPTQPEQSFGTQQLPPVDENDFLEQIIINPPPSGLEEAVLKKDCLLEDQLQLDLTQLESSISVADLLPATETPLTTEPIFTPPPAMAALPPPPPQPDTSASDLALLDNLIQTEEANNEVVDSIFNMESQPPAQPQQSLVPLQPNQPSGTDFDPYSSNLAPLGTLPPAYQPVPTPVQPPMLGLRPDIVAAHQLGKLQHQSSLEHNLMLGQPQPHFASAQHSIYHRPVSHYPMISSHSPSHHPNYRANYSSAAALPPQSFPHSFQPFSAHNQPPPPIPHPHRPSGQLFPHGGDLRANVMHHHQPPLQSFHHSVQGPSLDELHRSPRYADIRSTNYRHIFGRETPPGVLQHVPPSGMLSSSQSHHQSYPPPHHSQLQSSLLGHKSQSQHHRTHFNPMLQQHLPPPQPMLSQHNAGGFHQSNQQLLSGPISRQQPHHAPVLPTGRPLGRPEYRPPPMQQMSSSNGAPLSYLGQSPSSLYLRPETPPSQQQYLQSPLAMAAVQARSTSPPRYHGSTTSHPGLHSTPNPNTPTPGAAFYSSAAPQIRPTPPVKPSQSAPNLSQLLSSINPTPPPPLDSATTKKIILEAKQPTMIRDKLESKLRNIPGLMTSEALHDFLSNKNMLGAISKATPGNNALKDILTEAMESIHQLDGDEVQRLLANATPRSRRMSTASDTAFSGQLGSGETNFLDEIFSDSYTSADQAGIEEEIRQLQELESFDNEGQAAVDPAMDAAMTAASASTSRRSSRGTTSADQLLVSLVEKSLLSLANTDKSKRQRSPDGQIRSLISEMVESVQHESDNEGAGSIYRPANVEAEPLSDLNESEKFNVTGHPLMASLMAPPNVVPKPKPKEIKPKPEKPARVTLKYLLETIDGDTDDDRRDMTTQMNPVLFAPSTAPQSVPRTSTITRPSETIEMIESTPLKPVEQHSSSTSFEDVFKPIEPMPSQTSFTPYEPNLMQMILTPRPKADTPPPPPPPPPPAPYRPPMSMPILSALSALESLDPSNQPPVDYLVDLQPERPPQVPNAVEPVIAPVMPVMQPEIIDLEADMDMEPPAMGNSLQPLLTTTAQQTNVEVPLDVVPLEPVVAALPKRTDSPQVAAETAPIADIAVDSKPVEAVQSSPAEAARTTTPDQQICVDLLNDIVEMASGSVEPSTPPASPPRFDLDDKSKLAASDSARHLLLEDIIFDKTADSEVSKLFSNQLSTKRRRSMEVFVSLTNHSVSGSSTSPLISSTNAAAAKRCIRTNSLKSIDDFTSSLTPRFTESRSTPESRATSPDRSPTPVISTTHDQHRDLSLTDLGDSPHQCHSGETKDDHLHFSSSPLGKLRRLDFGDGDCDLDDVPSRTILDLPPKSTTPPPVFRARSRSLVIDVRNSELSLKTTTTDASNNTKQDVIFDFSQFVNANSKRTKKNQNNSRPTKRAKVETITSSSEEDEAACASTGKEPSVQHPDISSSVDDEKSCRFKHRKCCCHAEEDFDTEETETESDCSNARHRCCHRHHGSTATNTGEQSHSVLLKSTGGAEVPPPVTIHHHSSTGIPTVSINFNAENATTIIHINPSNNNNNKTNTGAAGDSTAATSKPIDN